MLNVHQVTPQYAIVLLSYSVDTGVTNILHNHLLYMLTGTSTKVNQQFLKLINFALENMNRESKVDDFINYLKQQVK